MSVACVFAAVSKCVPDAVANALRTRSHLILTRQVYEVGIVSILQMKRLRLREETVTFQSH